MDFFDSNGQFLGEGKALFDSEGNLVGHFLENAKNGVEDAFEFSWWWGLVFLFFIAPGWALLGLVLFLLIKLFRLLFFLLVLILKFALRVGWWLLKLVSRTLWWIVRLPFCLLFYHELPEY